MGVWDSLAPCFSPHIHEQVPLAASGVGGDPSRPPSSLPIPLPLKSCEEMKTKLVLPGEFFFKCDYSVSG